eukprot:73267_1
MSADSTVIDESKNEEKENTIDLDQSDDECTECIITPGNDRRVIICDSQNRNDGIIQCIGSIESQYIPDTKTQKSESIHGTGTVIHIDPQNRIYILTAAHNVRGVEKQCKTCNTKTLKQKCPNCNSTNKTKATSKLIKPKDIYFTRRGISKHNLGESIARYAVTNYILPDEYTKFSKPRDGFDLCI